MKRHIFIFLCVAAICLTACQEQQSWNFNIINIDESSQIVSGGPPFDPIPPHVGQCDLDVNGDNKTDIRISTGEAVGTYIVSASDDVEIALGPKPYTFELGDTIDADQDYWIGKNKEIIIPIIAPTHYIAIKVHRGTKTYCGWIDHTPVDFTPYKLPVCHQFTKVAICKKANTPILAGKTTLKD